MNKVITESEMDFIGCNSFWIEKSKLYGELRNRAIRSVEFIRCIDNDLWFVEAKKTFANPNNPSEDNYEKYLSEIDDICEKFIHSLNIYSSLRVGINNETFCSDFNPPEKIYIKFVLVIKNHEKEWCRAVQSKLKDVIMDLIPSYMQTIWNIDNTLDVYVFNHSEAIEKGLVSP